MLMLQDKLRDCGIYQYKRAIYLTRMGFFFLSFSQESEEERYFTDTIFVTVFENGICAATKCSLVLFFSLLYFTLGHVYPSLRTQSRF